MKKMHPMTKALNQELAALKRVKEGRGSAKDKKVYERVKAHFPTWKFIDIK